MNPEDYIPDVNDIEEAVREHVIPEIMDSVFHEIDFDLPLVDPDDEHAVQRALLHLHERFRERLNHARAQVLSFFDERDAHVWWNDIFEEWQQAQWQTINKERWEEEHETA